jgi:glycosyltransferase involved in cell wall biosynthesis
MPTASRRLRILTWHVHGNYLYALTPVPPVVYVVDDDERSTDHSGRSGTLPWGPNVHEAHVDRIKEMEFDVILFQSRFAYETEQYTLLSAAQQRLPMVYIEHDPPQEHPTNTKHWVNDRNVLLVHVTPFNQLMWDNRDSPTTVIEHGIKLLAPTRYSGEIERGVVVVNNIGARGRRLGADLFAQAHQQVPLTLVGMNAQQVGGHGELPNAELPGFMARHRFFFNPIRYTSLGLSIIEAMMVGLPIVGVATTELVTVIRNGENGFVDTRMERLIDAMQAFLKDPAEARRQGEAARRTAEERFNIDRFISDWMQAFARVAG